MAAPSCGRAALRRLLGSHPGLRGRRFVGVPLAVGEFRAPLSGQVRHARRRKSIVEQEGVDVLTSRASEEQLEAAPGGEQDEERGEFVLPEVPADILDAWEKDEMAQEALGMFSSEELRGKGLMSHRDVARMLELMGCDRMTFLRMLSGDGEDDDDDDDDDDEGADDDEGPGYKGKGGKGKGAKGGKGSMAPFDDDDEDFGPVKGGGKKGFKGSRDFDDSDDDFGPPKGKGGGKKGFKGSRDFDDSDDDFGPPKGKGGGKKGSKGSKGRGGFDDFSDDEGFASDFGRKGKGGKGGFKGKGKGDF